MAVPILMPTRETIPLYISQAGMGHCPTGSRRLVEVKMHRASYRDPIMVLWLNSL